MVLECLRAFWVTPNMDIDSPDAARCKVIQRGDIVMDDFVVTLVEYLEELWGRISEILCFAGQEDLRSHVRYW